MIVLTSLCVAFIFGVIAWEHIQAQSAATFTSTARIEKAGSVAKLVELSNRQIDTFAYDYGDWDDMVNFLAKRDIKWAQNGIDPELAIYNVDAIWVFDKNRKLAYGVASPREQALQRIHLPKGAFDVIAARKNRVRFFVPTSQGLVQISGATVRSTNDSQAKLPLSGYFIVARVVGDRYLNELSQMSNCRVTVSAVQSAAPQRVSSSGTFHQYLQDWQGVPIASFNFMTDSSFMDLVQSSHENAISLFVAFALIVLACTFLAIVRWVSSPLSVITEALATKETGTLSRLARKSTEFGQLARLVLNSFEQQAVIQEQIAERSKVEAELRTAREDLELAVQERTKELSETNRSLNDEIAERKRVEWALRKTEEKYRGIVDNAVEGIYQTTPDGVYINANPALARIYGYDSTEDLMRNLRIDGTSLYVHEDTRRRFVERVEAEEVVSGFESEIYRKDGATTWISENARAVRDIDGSVLYYEGTVEDVSARKVAETEIFRLNAHLEERLGRIVGLHRIDSAINSSHDLAATLQVFMKEVVDQLRIDAAAVLLSDSTAQRLKYIATSGFRTGGLRYTQMAYGSGYAGRAAQQRNNVYIPNLNKEQGSSSAISVSPGDEFVAYFAVPLIAKGQVKGVLEVMHRSELEPDQEWYDFLEALAGQAALAIDNANLFDGLQRTNIELSIAYDATIEGWSRVLDLRDKETEGHSQRVTEMTLRLAEAFGIDDEELIQIRRGALLHDIGKMGIPDQILLKPGPLTDQEWTIMKRHPEYAYEMLSPIEFLRPALDIPYCHHEKWDGTGYPQRLQGEDIPLAARIFAIVDVWDALHSNRPYRPGWSVDRIRQHILDLSGKHFDPAVVDAFVALIDEMEQETAPPELSRAA